MLRAQMEAATEPRRGGGCTTSSGTGTTRPAASGPAPPARTRGRLLPSDVLTAQGMPDPPSLGTPSTACDRRGT